LINKVPVNHALLFLGTGKSVWGGLVGAESASHTL